jgi:predicted nucleic acid-binding protein
VGLPWTVLTGFIRIAAQPRIWERPVPFDESLAIVASWLSRPCTWTPEAGPAHLDILQRLLGPDRSPRYVTDAHLAAIAIEHGLSVCSLDRDFARWEVDGLRWQNPLPQR